MVCLKRKGCISSDVFLLDDYKKCLRRGTFLGLILFVELGREDKVLCFKCNPCVIFSDKCGVTTAAVF